MTITGSSALEGWVQSCRTLCTLRADLTSERRFSAEPRTPPELTPL